MAVHRSSLVGFILLAIIAFSLPLTVFFSQQKQETQQHAAGTTVTVTVDLSSPIGTSQFVTGATHTQDDVTLSGTQSVISAAQKVISASLTFENVPIMGWGSPDPEPSPGMYDWSVLDSRLQFMRSTNTTKMITLCCAPGWMRDPSQANDWQYLDARPNTTHFQDFANLAKQVAQRYPDVQYFQVWNELKGFYNSSLNRWDYEGYTTFYNMIYAAIKSVRPDAKIGGPYPVMDTWADKNAGGWPAKDSTLYNQPWGTIDQRELDVIDYWLAHKQGGDFLVIDGGTGTREGTWPVDEFTAADQFPAIMNWIRKQPSAAILPIGWAEWYPNTPLSYTDINHYNAVFAHDLITVIKSGYWYALPWGTQGDNQGLNAFPASFMTNSSQSTVESSTLQAIKHYFGSGTQFYKTTVSANTVSVLASKTKTILVNHLANLQPVSVNGIIVNLNPYQVIVSDTPGSLTPSLTPADIPSPTKTITLSSTGVQTGTNFSIILCPHGLGTCGDNVNPNSGGNTNPLHAQRNVTLTIFDTNNNHVAQLSGTIAYNQATRNFQGTLPSGILPSGNYLVTVKLDGFLSKQIPGIITVTQGQTVSLQSVSVVNGDINNDNQLDIQDYNILIGCFGSKQTTAACTTRPSASSPGTDINDDGTVDGADYNLFLRELSVQQGSSGGTLQATPTPTTTTPNPTITPPQGYSKLILDDEFSGASIDTSKWNIEDDGPGGFLCGDLGYGVAAYDSNMVTISNGQLHLRTENTPYTGRSFRTGGVSTRNKLDFKYGRVDISAKLPTSQGYWPAMWFVGTDLQNTSTAFEIDLMEAVNNATTLYWNNHDYKDNLHKGSSTTPTWDGSKGFHIYTLIWQPSYVAWQLDGIEVFRVTQGISNINMFMIINTALGGSWPGNPNSFTIYPQSFDLDYVHIWQ